MMTCLAACAAMRPNCLVSTGTLTTSPILARLLMRCAASSLISTYGSMTRATTVFLTTISIFFFASSRMTSTLSSQSGVSLRNAVSMA